MRGSTKKGKLDDSGGESHCTLDRNDYLQPKLHTGACQKSEGLIQCKTFLNLIRKKKLKKNHCLALGAQNIIFSYLFKKLILSSLQGCLKVSL